MTDKTLGACQCHEEHAPTYWKGVVREYKDALEKAESRPLTPDAITDEMVERGARVLADWDGAGGWGTPQWGGEIPERAYIHAARQALTAALTEPPARPEGAERFDPVVDAAIRGHSDITSPNVVRAISDAIAEDLADPTREGA